ncbi:hypothetical protein SAMN05216490_1920 [Mucilaginibacter mallensis]|uniref:Uncharacterized protein n=1 Tax=Mucilaginibacter mallensis TaxID=652787 RepID=A0A1H1VIZ2_MUCMA|nr:hypothetical protein [Mucilaginibacter mallensis]SDS84039.1 hypothetical protein SAMN05216490_1920 [Mucilaginibacter mallensis]
MTDFTEINKLDEILKFIVNQPKNITFGEVKIIFNYPNEKEIDEILHKLEKDGFIQRINDYKDPSNQTLPNYLSTFDGRLFVHSGGYKAKALENDNNRKLTDSELARHQMLDNHLEANTSRLNRLTLWLAIGTIVLALSEIVKFVIFCLSSQKTL